MLLLVEVVVFWMFSAADGVLPYSVAKQERIDAFMRCRDEFGVRCENTFANQSMPPHCSYSARKWRLIDYVLMSAGNEQMLTRDCFICSDLPDGFETGEPWTRFNNRWEHRMQIDDVLSPDMYDQTRCHCTFMN